MAHLSNYSLTYQYGKRRILLVLLWGLYMGWVGVYWLDLEGLGLVLVGLTRPVKRLLALRHTQRGHSFETIDNYWVWPWVICVRRQQDRQYYWLFKDEMDDRDWRRLNLYLRLNVPHQAVGLSMSK